MKRLTMLICLLVLLPACRPTVSLTPSPTVVASPQPSQTPTPVLETPTATPSATPTQTSMPTPVPTHTATPVPTPFLPDVLTGPADLRQPAGRVLWYRGDGLWLVDPETGDRQRALAVLPDAPHCYDVYLYDRETGTTTLLGETR